MLKHANWGTEPQTGVLLRLTCLSLKERLLFVRTFSLWRIIMKFLFLFFSLLLVLANGFSLLCFFAKSFLSDRPACWEKKINT